MSKLSYEERCRAIHLLKSGKSPQEVAEGMGRCIAWVYKWRKRYQQGGWSGLHDRSRAPKHIPHKLGEDVKQAIRQTRSELEAEAREPGKLSYIGARAIRQRLARQKISPLPGVSSIERELRAAGLVRPYQRAKEPEVKYPHLKPEQPHQVVQIDIVPHYLSGGQSVACFNALDIVSRYPTGQQLARKRAQDARQFLLHVWQEMGIPQYTQMDNESCFSGGFTHPYVLGQVLRLGLWVGTQIVYSPFYHPESNGYVERFHQDYNDHIWDKIELPDLVAVQTHSPVFFENYRRSDHHSALSGRTPADIHHAYPCHHFPDNLFIPEQLPLTAGKVHFIRRVTEEQTIRLLNVDWPVLTAQVNQGVWATLKLSSSHSVLAIFDQAPGAVQRRCLARHPFPLKEAIVPLQDCFRSPSLGSTFWAGLVSRSIQWLSTIF